MDNKQLYQLVLGLEPPWYVSQVEVRKDDEEIRIDLDRSSCRFRPEN